MKQEYDAYTQSRRKAYSEKTTQLNTGQSNAIKTIVHTGGEY